MRSNEVSTPHHAGLARGAYQVDEATRQTTPPEPPWVGRVQTVLDEEHVRLVTPRGTEWTAHVDDLSEASAAQRAAYDVAVPHRAGVRA
ncbi:hypothetical protein MMF93_23865 [Streptomyces tubbatahanensis]|uniref:Uncharacterized protein n=1 Tax=Streptomyces tubbatahanensis TaxID=2923272 RepID=A0ABY3XXC6_9ACTN|nr:hypothetical protein [Streptomyces tubbatahanensis]UNS99161.1 hypothetical protein MMF93_23865 [Streptomyces tubbatahanensis]